MTATAPRRLPHFLIIGSMKSGTTSLYEDLLEHPQFFLPEEKEPDSLTRDEVLTEGGQRRYTRLFEPSEAGQLLGEASTSYTKLPTYPGVAQRAKQLLGQNLKLVYLVRDPLARARSHHAFLYQMGLMPPDVNAVAQSDQTLVQYSQYAMQLEPWLAEFGTENVLVVQFEKYIRDRQSEYERVCEFLGADEPFPHINPDRAANQTGSQPQLRGFWRNVRNHPIYQKGVRPLFFWSKKRSKLGWLRKLLAKPPLPPPEKMTEETQAMMVEQFREDVARLVKVADIDLNLWPALANEEISRTSQT